MGFKTHSLICSAKVNGIDLRQATHDEAIGVLRLATQRVCLCVFRHQEAYREEDLWDVFSVELRARPGEGLGFATIGKWYAEDVDVIVQIETHKKEEGAKWTKPLSKAK